MKYILSFVVYCLLAVLSACVGASFATFFTSMLVGVTCTVVSCFIMGLGVAKIVEGILK